MKRNFWAAVVIACSTQLFAGSLRADNSTCGNEVDMADSLDFSKLHVDCSEEPDFVYDPEEGTRFFGRNKKAVDTYSQKNTDQPSGLDQHVSRLQSGSQGVVEEDLSAQVTKQASAQLNPAEQLAKNDLAEKNASVVFNIREPFSVTGGPQSALNGLFAQMVHYCPQGWEKLKEWSVPAQSDYFLHYQFQCAE